MGPRQGLATEGLLGRFLVEARRSSRALHGAIYEDLVATLRAYVSSRRRQSLLPGDLQGFLADWYLRYREPLAWRRTRRFCAATGVLTRWLSRDMSPRRRRTVRREWRRVAHAVTRAAMATELLETLSTVDAAAEVQSQVDDYCEIVARGSSHVVLRPLASAKLLGPLEVPPALAASLDPGAVVNLRLGKRAGRWCVLEYGYCYPAVAREALLEARALRMQG